MPFLNAVAVVETSRTASEMLELLQSIEQNLGRERRVRWDARSIDLDLVLYGTWIGQELRLTLPHPRLAARAFVLVPACDVAENWFDPRCGWTVRQLASHLQRAVPSLAVSGGDRELRVELCRRLQAHGISTIAEPQPVSAIGVRGQAPVWSVAHAQPSAEAQSPAGELFCPPIDRPWVAAFVPDLPRGYEYDRPTAPRVIACLETADVHEPWPSPHQLWPNRGLNPWSGWPEYWIRGSDLSWIEGELLAALESMRCELRPITSDGRW